MKLLSGMLTQFHEFRATSHLRNEGTFLKYPITFHKMKIPGGKVVRAEFTLTMEYKTSVIRAILQNRHKKQATYRQIIEATLDHMNAQIRNQ